MTSSRSTCLSVLAVLATACGGDSGEPGPATPAAGLLASAPIPTSLLPDGAAANGPLVFVSATPGTSAGAASVLVRSAHGDSAVGMPSRGGFDPLPVAAAEGDLVSVTFVDSGGRQRSEQLQVKRRVPPRVVRTSPAPTQTDVPLNVRILVVFSAPIDGPSAAEGVQLLRDGEVVPAQVRQTPDALVAELVPVSQLAASVDYEVIVAATVRDVLGNALGQPLTIPFRTGTTTATISSVNIIGHEYPWLNRLGPSDRLDVGQRMDLWAIGNGAQMLAGVPATWSSSDPSVVRVTERSPGFAIQEGLRSGHATIRAEVDGVSDEVVVNVFGPIPADVLASTKLYTSRGDYEELWVQRADGTLEALLFSVAELPSDPTLCNESITQTCYWQPHAFAVGPAERLVVARASGIGGVWIKDGVQGTIRRINPAEERGAAQHPAWSPDGTQLAYWMDFHPQAETELRVVNADGTGHRVLQRIPYDTIIRNWNWPTRNVGGTPFVWHPDGWRLLVQDEAGTRQVPIDGSGPSLYLAGYYPGPWFPGGLVQFVFQWLTAPNGQVVQRVFRADRQGTVDASTSFEGGVNAVSPDGRLMADWEAIYTMDRRASALVPDVALGGILGFVP